MAVPFSAAGASQGFQEPEVVCGPKWRLCESCLGITIDRLSGARGYTHSWLEVLEETAKWCKLCSYVSCSLNTQIKEWDEDQIMRYRNKITPHRYKIILSLVLSTKYRKARPDHCHNPEFKPRCIFAEVLDTRPLEFSNDGAHPTIVRGSKVELDYDEPQQEVTVLQTWLLCHTQEGDPAMTFGLPWLRNVEYTGSSESIEVARGWLQQCLATNDKDSTERFATLDAIQNVYGSDGPDSVPVTPFPAERPARLIEIVSSAKDADMPHGHSVKLIETTKEREYPYAALSYCWGKMTQEPITHTWLTQRMTIEQHLEGIDIGCLPATIRDCIKVAFSLGMHYVWVDSLCIVQDDSSDWEAESAKMGGIYRGAHLTMAASRSNSSSGGLFNWKKGSPYLNPFDEYLCVENRLRSGEKSCLYFESSSQGWDLSPRRHLFGLEVYRSPLTQRAWAYQEQILSRRTLHFAESQLYWECDHCRLSQDNSMQKQSMREAYSIPKSAKPLTVRLCVRQWYCGAVEAYTKRALTYPDDRMVATSAVAKATSMNRHVKYYVGLWEDCIRAGLCWYRDSTGEKDQASRCQSWSWASQLSSVSYGEINYRYEGYEEISFGKGYEEVYGYENLIFSMDGEGSCLYMAKILNIQVKSSEKNPFGHVQSGQIVL